MLQQYNPKNADLKIYVKDGLYHRSEAKVSVFDSVVQGGDAVWEGIRVYKGRIFSLDKHLQRLQDSAHALAFTEVPSKEAVKQAIFETLQANEMRDDTHIRLTLTRGEKITSGMDPRLNQMGACLIIVAEWKAPVYDNKRGISLITSHIRRNAPQHLDSKIHHNNLLNNILAKIEANHCGADDAIMLDNHGFVSETNATNLFMVRDGVLYTSHADACLPGITRGLCLELAREMGIPAQEKNLSLTEFYTADEVFVTGTMGELTPVREIDGRTIVNKKEGSILDRILTSFNERTATEGEPLPF